MPSIRKPRHEGRLSTVQTQVLGWVASGDVLRDAQFAYQVVGRRDDIDNVVYQLYDLELIDLLEDGRVVTTPAGARCWSLTQPRRHAASTWNRLQFIPASVPPRL